MSRTSTGRLLLLVGTSVLTINLANAQVVFSDDFNVADGTSIQGKAPLIGQNWDQPGGPAMLIQNGILNTTGAARQLFGGFTQRFDGTHRLIKMTADITLLSHNGGYAGISFFDDGAEKMFLGDLSGTNPSIGFEITGAGQSYANPVTATGQVTLIYDSSTGRTALYSGATTTGTPLASTIASPGLTFNRIRVQNDNGGDIAINSVSVEMLDQGTVSIDTFKPDVTIIRQGDAQNVDWSTSFANQVTLTGFGTVETAGSRALSLAPGDHTLTLTATDTATSNSASQSVTVRTVAGGSSTYRYVRFKMIRNRNPSVTNWEQMADLRFFSATGEVIPVAAENPGGNSNNGEGVASLIDGNPTTKWLDFNAQPAIIDLGTGSTSFREYTITTGNDAPERDPVRWTLEGSNDKTTWTLIDNVTAFDFPIPTARQVGSDIIPLPGATLQPYVSLLGSATTAVSGDTVLLNYQAGGASTATISDGTTSTPVTGTSGTLIVHPTQNTTYTLTATTAGGQSATATFAVATVSPAITNIAYANFDSSGNELSLIGNDAGAPFIVNDFATRPQPGDHKRLRVTDAANSIESTVWFRKRQNVASGFDTTFNMQISRTDNGTGADGMSFIVQNAPQGSNLKVPTAEASTQTNALVVGFDAFVNDANDPSAATLRVLASGTVLTTVNLATIPGITLLGTNALMDPTGQGAPYPVRVVYAAGSLNVYFQGVQVVQNLAVDLSTIGAVASDGTAYVGFAARTGGLSEAHDITAWTLTTGGTTPATDVKLVSYSVTANTVTMTWTSSASKTYRITSSADLLTWPTVLKSGIQGVAGQTTSSATFTRGTKGFFRVEQE